jgi:hypothetical protein
VTVRCVLPQVGTGNIYVLDADAVWNTNLSIKIKAVGLFVTVWPPRPPRPPLPCSALLSPRAMPTH